MRIPLWPGVRLSVWEKQNPEAVKVTLACSKPYEPIRRVLSMRGWMLLWVRYDWKDYNSEVPDPSRDWLVQELTKELHRRSTHLDLLAEDHPLGPTIEGVVQNVRGEVLGLQAALGIALGGVVKGGDADRRAYEYYRAWAVDGASEWSRCRCVSCEMVLAGGER